MKCAICGGTFTPTAYTTGRVCTWCTIARRSELCDCRLPECGQCTELVDKGVRNERMPLRPTGGPR